MNTIVSLRPWEAGVDEDEVIKEYKEKRETEEAAICAECEDLVNREQRKRGWWWWRGPVWCFEWALWHVFTGGNTISPVWWGNKWMMDGGVRGGGGRGSRDGGWCTNVRSVKGTTQVLIHGAFSRCYLFTFLTVMNRHFCKYYTSSRQPDIHGSDVCVLVRAMRYDRYHDTGRTIQYTDKDDILIQLIYWYRLYIVIDNILI